jgi:ABC-type transport system involved in multi-copper enzyme maturation permease subunit
MTVAPPPVRTAPSSAILYREVSRAARRWQTYAVRTSFSAALLALVLATVWLVTSVDDFGVDPSQFSVLGRGMFVAFAVVQVLLSTLIAPFGVAQAVIEERDDDTLDVLALTRLTPGQILLSKGVSRVLSLLMLVVGALPVLAMVVSLGGVSVVEVVSVTLHAVLTVVLLGALGGFFALFTRSPVLATAAALGYGGVTFVGLPLLYGALTFDYATMAYVSPLFGTAARDWLALLPIPAYLPSVALIAVLGNRFFALRIERAAFKRYFDWGRWSARWAAATWGAVGLGLLTVVPLAAAAAWATQIATTSAFGSTPTVSLPVALTYAVSATTLWWWTVALLTGWTWLYLRLGLDLVLLIDDQLTGAASRRRRADPNDVHIWGSPVMWREVRPSAFKVALPGLTTWVLLLVAFFETGIWLVPGGLLGVGLVNVAAATVLGLWLAASTWEVERRNGTLDILLATPLPAWQIVLGKLLGVAVPASPLLLIAWPLILVGAPHLQLVFADHGRSYLEVFVVAVAACGWTAGYWLASVMVTMSLAVGLHNRRAGHPVALLVVGLFTVGPPIAGTLLYDVPLAALPFRLLVPVLVPQPTWWEVSLSASALFLVSLVLFVGLSVGLRRWRVHD